MKIKNQKKEQFRCECTHLDIKHSGKYDDGSCQTPYCLCMYFKFQNDKLATTIFREMLEEIKAPFNPIYRISDSKMRLS